MAATAITCLREDELFSYMYCSNGPGVEHLKEKPFTTDSIDQLLTYYALKAIEFPPPVILTPQEACKSRRMNFLLAILYTMCVYGVGISVVNLLVNFLLGLH